VQNVIVLGAARSGTSMVAGLFRHSGLYQGDRLLPPNDANPRGFFEDEAVIEVNETLLDVPKPLRRLRYLAWRLSGSIRADNRAYFLAAPRRTLRRKPDPQTRRMMRELLTRQPFCFKDPRFNATLPAWRDLLPANTRFLVVFREPHKTLNSMLRIGKFYDPPIAVTLAWVRKGWIRTYRRLLAEYALEGDWLFVHYDDVLSGTALPAIRIFSGAPLDASILDPNVSLSQDAPPISGDAELDTLHGELRERARLDLIRWAGE
jgi:hypothetical protein